MPKTTQPQENEAPISKNTTGTKKSDYFELKLPRVRFADTPLSPLWVILLLVFSFLLGMTTMKLYYTEKALGETQGNGNAPIAQTPTEENPLGAKVDIAVGTLPFLGDENAKVTIVEFSDFQCPYCKRFFDDTYAQIKADYIDTGKAKLYYRHLPLAIHPFAQDAAEASECANDQGKFWEYHDLLFENFDGWTVVATGDLPATLTGYAGDLGLNTDEFSACLANNTHEKKVTDDMAEGQTAGATGTPTFFINGKPLVGAYPYETFKTIIDEELNNSK